MTLAMRAGSRPPLPQPPTMTMDREAAWYEHEERMRPSYIAPPPQSNAVVVAAAQYFANKVGPPGRSQQPPLSPSSRWGASPQYGGRPAQAQPPQVASPSNGTRMEAHYPFPESSHGAAQAGAAATPFYTSPSRMQGARPEGYRAFSVPSGEEQQHRGGMKGSAFMHKGFFDILSLVNNQSSRPAPPSGFRATFSKATGRFRKDSNAGARNGLPQGMGGGGEDPFFSTPAPPLQSVNINSMWNGAGASAAAQKTKRATMPAGSTLSPLPVIAAPMGPRAAKKRISIDMVSAPRLDSFVHAAHASDAEQAEEILHRWGRDNVGKVADPEWTERCKAAMRVQAARNQAEAIAQIQAALHQESAFKENPRQLHIVNGTPSNLTYTTVATATVGHGSLSGASVATQRPPPVTQTSVERITEEKGGFQPPSAASPHTPRRRLPGAADGQSPNVPPARPNMLPRSNTQGTMLVVSPGAAPAGQFSEEQALLLQQQRQAEVPDYLQYQPVLRADDGRRVSKAIDGLPGSGGGGAGGIDALFEARPASMVVRDSISVTPRTLAGEELSDMLASHAGAALRPSLTTVEKSVAAKIYFENLYYGILKKPQARETRRAGLEAELALLRIPEASKQAIRNAWTANETEYLRDIRARVNVNSFSRLKTIGHGAFGVVALVREQGTGELYAMKQLRKADMLRKGQEGHVRAERDLMTSASASQTAKWIVKLVYSFQDVDHLYLIMEFMGGGDLLNLLIEKDIFAEDFARFYVAEMILSIHEAHRLGYIHRDIKPDNFLFTAKGHVKLADFGLCQSFHWAHDGAYYDQQRKNLLKKHGIDLDDSGRTNAGDARAAAVAAAAATAKAGGRGYGALSNKELDDVMIDRNEDGTPLTHVLTWRERNRKKIAYSVVGTNNYMAPEVLRGHGYDQSCDWWSLGVIVFEMLYGYPPFVSKSRHLTRQKILNWRQTLRFPPKPRISREAQDFVSRLICERDDRLGSQSLASVSRPNSLLQGSRQPSGFINANNEGKAGLVDGVEELMAHPWFRGIDWNTIHTAKAPFVPALRHAADTKHFEDDIDDEPLPAPGAAEAAKNGLPAPVEQARDPMLRDKAHGQHLLEMRKQLAFVGYTFKSPKTFDPRTQLTESKINAIERSNPSQPPPATQSVLTGSRLRSMSM